MPELRMNFIFLLLFFFREWILKICCCVFTPNFGDSTNTQGAAETTSVGEGSDGNGPLLPWRNPLS